MKTTNYSGRAFRRVKLHGTTITVQYPGMNEGWRHYLSGEDLSEDAISLSVSLDDPIVSDFELVSNKPVLLDSHAILMDFFPVKGFLYRTDRVEPNRTRWTFFFNEKLQPEQLETVRRQVPLTQIEKDLV